jgi:signal transduction histidine kinase
MRLVSFNLRLWFFLTGFGVIATLASLFAVTMSNFIFEIMVDREVEVTRDFLQSVVRAERLDASVFAPAALHDNEGIRSFARHIQDLPGTLRANIYAIDRSILWSTDAALIGRRFDDNDELRAALTGKLLGEVVEADTDAKTEHAALNVGDLGYFIEAYIPIRGRENGIVAVVELYKLPVALDAALRSGRRIVWLSAAGGALVLFVTLFWIVRRAAILIERQQLALSQMEALAALGQMAGGVAHNLRNPMAGIRSSAELIQLETPDATGLAADIVGEVDRMERTVRQLLEFTRSEAPTPQRVDPLGLVTDTLALQRPALERDGITVLVTDRRRRKQGVHVDPVLIAQAMTSIVVNAREAMANGGRLHIELRDVGARLHIVYTDNGPGVPADIMHRISEPFFTTKTRGLGLGLALARRIVERFGGRLEIANAPGGGASVRIELSVV